MWCPSGCAHLAPRAGTPTTSRSPEWAHRDRHVKLRKYADVGIANVWRIEDEAESPVVHAYELDGPTRSYVPTGIHRRELRTTTPFAITIDLDKLVPGRKS